jgi:hypothetical protein
LEKFVIDIQDKAAGLRGLLSPGEIFCDDISSSDCIDMDEGSIKDNEEKNILNKKYRTQRRMKNMTMTTIIISITKQSMVRATVTVAKMTMIRVIMNTMRRMKNMTMMMMSRMKMMIRARAMVMTMTLTLTRMVTTLMTMAMKSMRVTNVCDNDNGATMVKMKRTSMHMG